VSAATQFGTHSHACILPCVRSSIGSVCSSKPHIGIETSPRTTPTPQRLLRPNSMCAAYTISSSTIVPLAVIADAMKFETNPTEAGRSIF
jgi:hypothetical protein